MNLTPRDSEGAQKEHLTTVTDLWLSVYKIFSSSPVSPGGRSESCKVKPKKERKGKKFIGKITGAASGKFGVLSVEILSRVETGERGGRE